MKCRTNRLTAHTSSTTGQVPRVYLAGKIRKHCWRHSLVSGLREHTWDDGVLPQGEFDYIGPFFVGCDHGCFHGTDSHGAFPGCGAGACPGLDDVSTIHASHQEVSTLCLLAITRADLMFCYIDSTDCFGTLVEIGYALAHQIPFVIAIAPGLAESGNNDFWFPCIKAHRVIYGVDEQELPAHLMSVIRRYA